MGQESSMAALGQVPALLSWILGPADSIPILCDS